MPTFDLCKNTKEGRDLLRLANDVMREQERHAKLIGAEVKIDFLFAYPKYDDRGNPVGDALKSAGYKAVGLCKIVNLKDRAKGNADAEIQIDWEHWKTIDEAQQKAILDHELYHLHVQETKGGIFKRDDLGRPKLSMRKHDHQYGWFTCIAATHGIHSVEHKQALKLFIEEGQYYLPLFHKLANGEITMKIQDEAESMARQVRMAAAKA